MSRIWGQDMHQFSRGAILSTAMSDRDPRATDARHEFPLSEEAVKGAVGAKTRWNPRPFARGARKGLRNRHPGAPPSRLV